MVNYTRVVRMNDAVDKIEWIEVVSLDQLEPLKDFRNQVSDAYHAQPEIDPTCNKNLKTPLDSFHSFMKIILRSVIPNTNEYLRVLGQKRTSYEEIVEFIMVSMAVVITSGKFQHLQSSVSDLRQFYKTQHGISPKWQGENRLQKLRNCLRSYGEHENEILPGKMWKTK